MLGPTGVTVTAQGPGIALSSCLAKAAFVLPVSYSSRSHGHIQQTTPHQAILRPFQRPGGDWLSAHRREKQVKTPGKRDI